VVVILDVRAFELAREGCLVFEFTGEGGDAVIGGMSDMERLKLRECLSCRC